QGRLGFGGHRLIERGEQRGFVRQIAYLDLRRDWDLRRRLVALKKLLKFGVRQRGWFLGGRLLGWRRLCAKQRLIRRVCGEIFRRKVAQPVERVFGGSGLGCEWSRRRRSRCCGRLLLI